MLEALIAAGAGIDERDHDGDTPVHYAAVQGELECVEALARAGAKLDLKDNDGETPAHVAHKSVKKRLKELVQAARTRLRGRGGCGCRRGRRRRREAPGLMRWD